MLASAEVLFPCFLWFKKQRDKFRTAVGSVAEWLILTLAASTPVKVFSCHYFNYIRRLLGNFWFHITVNFYPQYKSDAELITIRKYGNGTKTVSLEILYFTVSGKSAVRSKPDIVNAGNRITNCPSSVRLTEKNLCRNPEWVTPRIYPEKPGT